MANSNFLKSTLPILTEDDKAFLVKAINGIKEEIEAYKSIIACEKRRKLVWFAPEKTESYFAQLASYEKALNGHEQRKIILEKIQTGSPYITASEKKLFEQMPAFQKSIVSRYPLVEEKPEIKMQYRQYR